MNAGGGVLLLHQLNKKMVFQSIYLGSFWFDSNLELVFGTDKYTAPEIKWTLK